jgi:2-keto-4-pentenoate hydratase/2-oxohepta-3-ene-1,7-dioic acid hydratase in catechol pathway
MELLVGSERINPCRVFCIGKNYAEHVREMGGTAPGKPVVFMKPRTSLVPAGRRIAFPEHGSTLHHEAEVVVLVGRDGRPATETDALGFIRGISLGLDLTLRDIQGGLKAKGLPWEVSKAFDQSAPIGDFVAFGESLDLGSIEFTCHVNQELRQSGNTRDMIFSIPRLLTELGRVWRLLPGDLVYTGTPEGVGPLRPGDTVTVQSTVIGEFSWLIVSAGSGLSI